MELPRLSFQEFRKIAKSLGYSVKSHVVSFCDLARGGMRFYALTKDGEKACICLERKKSSDVIEDLWNKEREKHKEVLRTLDAYDIFDKDGLKCLPE